MVQDNKANTSYNEYHNRAIKQLRDIEKLLENHENKTIGNGANWAQVGDMTHVIEVLDEITNFLS